MEIAPGYTDEMWKNDRVGLPKLGTYCPEWESIIKHFDERIRSRYVEPIQILLDAYEQDLKDNVPEAKRKKVGFAVVALDFILIELIQALRYCEISTKGKSTSLVKKFFQKSPSFLLSSNQAYNLYEKYRCSISHNAQTDGNFLVNAKGAMFDWEGDSPTKINRSEFHIAVMDEFDRYIDELKNKGSKFDKLRAHIRERLDLICGVTSI